MDNLVDRFEASNLLLHDLIARTEKMEVWCKQMQEDGRFVYDSDVQESASLDETVKPTQVLGDTVDKEDESVHGGVVEQTNIDEFEKEVQKSSNVVEQLEGILESELSSPSLEPTERRSREREDTTQGTGVLGHGSVKEREEFEDENREQEELRQLEKPDESDELVQDLAASSENKEDFGQGTEELREDSVELDTAKGSGTALSERVRLGEGAEEKGNYYESEELEVEGCNHEGRLAEEVDKQEEAVQSEAGNEEQTEHDYISEPVEWKVCIGGAKLESSEEMEKILPGEGGIQEELVQRKTEDEENKENIHELQLAGIEGCVREVSEHLEREMSEVAGKGVETAGTRIEGEEKIEDDYELVSIEMEECTEESVLDTSKQFERRLSEGEGIEEDVVQSNTENEEQEEENNVLQLTDIQIYMEEALLDTSERLERRCSEEADIRHDAEDSEENEHTCELEPAKVEECTEEARFDTSGGPYRRLCEEGGKEKEMAHCKTEGEEENLRDCKPDVAKLEECIEEASSTSEHSNRRLCEEAEKQEDVVKDEPQEGDEKEHYYETERTIVEECVEEGRFGTTEEMERRHSEERGKEEDVLQCKIEAEEETEIGYKSQPTKIDEGTEEAKLNTSEKFGSRLSDEAGNEQEVLGSKTQEGEKEQPDSELEMSAGKGCVIAVSLDTSEESETQLPVEIKKRDMIQNEIQETLRLITINVENKMDVTMPCTLRKSVGDCITKLVESSVTELNQKVLALEDKLTEQNRVNCRLKEEIRRLYRELTKTAEKSNSLKEQIKAFQEKANTEALKQKVYQTYALDLAGKCYDVSVSAEKGIMKCRRKYDILKSKYNARAKHEGECEKSDLLDTDMDELADEAMEREMALVLQCQRELKENFKTVFETPPMVQHFDVEKVKNTEALNKCRVEVLEDIQKSPLSQLKAMEAILTKEKREHVSTLCHFCT
jgi:hypothetical protein